MEVYLKYNGHYLNHMPGNEKDRSGFMASYQVYFDSCMRYVACGMHESSGELKIERGSKERMKGT